jgi:multiple sugar transport system substrate-binding protein
MKATFAFIFFGLMLLSFVVWEFQPPATVAGKVVLTRVSDSNPVRQKQIDLFNSLYPKLDLTLDPTAGDIQKVIVQSLGGVGPDVFDCFDPFQLSAYVQSGIALDLTDEFAKRGINLQKDVFPGILPTAIYQGRVYGMPTNIAADGIWFHRDLLKEIGVPPHKGPWHWDEFIPIAQKLTQRDAQGHPIRYGFLFEWWDWEHFFKGFGAKVYTADGTRCIVDSPQAIAAIQLMHDLVYKYRVSSTPVEESTMATAGGFGSGSISVFGAKHAAMALGGRYWLAELRKYRDIDIGVMESPFATVRQFTLHGRSVLINSASPHRQEAMDALFYMAGPEYNNLVNDQADGIGAFRKYTDTPRFLFNKDYPKETDNEVWRQITEFTIGDESSPFSNGQVVGTVMTEQLDLVKADQKTPAQAMHDAAREINEDIQKNLKGDPGLAEKYRQTVQGRHS